MPPQKPELLAPAGTLAAGISAFDAGADAVYAGLGQFNARERGRNLTAEDFGKLCTYARRGNRSVYLTLNTLVKESELPAVADLLAEVLPSGPRAVIVQDLGVLRLLRRHFPEYPVHASTQMGAHNSAGVRVLADMGVERVILQRQLTFEEIGKIVAKSPIEVEAFVHGALCCSRSGQCLLSSWLGGWSGNRGKCKQACRRRYRSEDGNGFFLSTNDLSLLEHVHELAEMGVASLKIEGRLRGPDYADSVVRAYRMMLDAPPGERKPLLKTARGILAESLGRRWSPGFRTREDFAKVVDHRSLGSSGLLCGTVRSVVNNGFLVEVSRPLRKGDRIRVQPRSGDEGPSLEITRLEVGRQTVRTAKPGLTAFIGFDESVPADGMVYKTANPAANWEVRLARLPRPVESVPVAVHVFADCVLARTPAVPGEEWRYPVDLPSANKRPLDAQTVAAEFAKGDTESLGIGPIQAKVAPDLFMPASVLKAARQAFRAWLEERFDAARFRTLLQERAEAAKAALTEPFPEAPLPVQQTLSLERGHPPKKGDHVARPLFARVAANEEAVLPDLCPEHRLSSVRKRVEELVELGVKRFRVTSLYGFALLKPFADVVRVTSFPLPAANSLAVRQLLDLGAARSMLWLELERSSLEETASRVGRWGEQYVFGRPALLATRAKLPVSGKLRDARNLEFELVDENGETHLLAETPFAVPPLADFATFRDLRHTSSKTRETHDLNDSHDWV
jgi:putative protease